jgi:hypothetical protein
LKNIENHSTFKIGSILVNVTVDQDSPIIPSNTPTKKKITPKKKTCSNFARSSVSLGVFYESGKLLKVSRKPSEVGVGVNQKSTREDSDQNFQNSIFFLFLFFYFILF